MLLTQKEQPKLNIFERKTIRSILGPLKTEQEVRRINVKIVKKKKHYGKNSHID